MGIVIQQPQPSGACLTIFLLNKSDTNQNHEAKEMEHGETF